jgi:hypothetical protein
VDGRDYRSVKFILIFMYIILRGPNNHPHGRELMIMGLIIIVTVAQKKVFNTLQAHKKNNMKP